MLAAILLLITGLTLGAANGWRTLSFLVPFLLSIITFPLVFLWEARLPFDYALLPPSVWRIPNFTTLIIFSLYLYSWHCFAYLPLIQVYVDVNGESSILAAVRTTPARLAAMVASICLTIYPRFVAHLRRSIVIGMLGAAGALVLFALSDGATGLNYWKFVFPGGIIGSGGLIVLETSTSVGIMMAVPPEMAGVAGAIFQVACQVGQVVTLSIQGALLTIQPGDYGNWVNVRTLFIFGAAWGLVWLAGFLVFYRPVKRDDKAGSQKIRENS